VNLTKGARAKNLYQRKSPGPSQKGGKKARTGGVGGKRKGLRGGPETIGSPLPMTSLRRRPPTYPGERLSNKGLGLEGKDGLNPQDIVEEKRAEAGGGASERSRKPRHRKKSSRGGGNRKKKTSRCRQGEKIDGRTKGGAEVLKTDSFVQRPRNERTVGREEEKRCRTEREASQPGPAGGMPQATKREEKKRETQKEALAKGGRGAPPTA